MGVNAEDSRGAQNEMQKRALFAYFDNNINAYELELDFEFKKQPV
ncbi:hypothetical protein SC206_14340 [Rouxiella sp. T17]